MRVGDQLRSSDPVETFVQPLTGAQAEDCGRHRHFSQVDVLTKSLECAIAASAKRRPFWTIKYEAGAQELGFVPSLAHGLLGKSDGTIVIFWWDSAACGDPGCSARFTVESCSVPAVVADGSRSGFGFRCKR